MEIITGFLKVFLDVYTKGIGLNIGGDPNATIKSAIKHDGSLFDTVFPIMDDTLKGVFIAAGFTILLLIITFKAFQMITASADKSDDSVMSLIVGSALTGVLIAFSHKIIYFFETCFNSVYKGFRTLLIDERKLLSEDNIGDIFSTDTISNGNIVEELALTVLCVIIGFALLFNLFRLMMEIFQRYIILGLLYYMAPMAVATWASKSTRPICGSFFKMMISQFILMFMNLIILTIFVSGLHAISNVEEFKLTQYIAAMLLLLGVLLFGQRIDEYLKGLGLDVATTGQGLGAAVLAGMGGAMATFKAAKKIGGKAIHGMDVAGGKMADLHRKSKTGGEGIVSGKPLSEQAKDKVNPKVTSEGRLRRTSEAKGNQLTPAGGLERLQNSGKGKEFTPEEAAETARSFGVEGQAASWEMKDGVLQGREAHAAHDAEPNVKIAAPGNQAALGKNAAIKGIDLPGGGKVYSNVTSDDIKSMTQGGEFALNNDPSTRSKYGSWVASGNNGTYNLMSEDGKRCYGNAQLDALGSFRDDGYRGPVKTIGTGDEKITVRMNGAAMPKMDVWADAANPGDQRPITDHIAYKSVSRASFDPMASDTDNRQKIIDADSPNAVNYRGLSKKADL